VANAGAASQGAQAQDVPQAWHALLRDHSLQFDFPDAGPAPTRPAWLIRLIEFLGAHAEAFRILGWVVVAALVLTVGFYLVRWLVRRGLSGAEYAGPRPLPAWQPSAQQARLMIADADALAAEGRFAEAVHLLLLVCIQEIAERSPGRLAPALTSREIARLPTLSPMAQQIFFEIALVVERSIFGARPLGASDYDQCRTAFERFTIPEVWRAAA
jgi:hypothetical protein